MLSHISGFITKQAFATICCVDSDNTPYCFNCTFTFDTEKNLLYFKSSAETRHVKLFLQNRHLAGTILPDKIKPLVIQGVQFTGTLLDSTDPEASEASKKYHRQHPIAIAKKGDVWTVKVDTLKMTDSTKGFGAKIHWEREAVAETTAVPS